jgi:DNA polymerase-3 subunit alpha
MGIVTDIKKRKTKNGDMMAIFWLEDITGTVEVAVMPNVLQEREAILQVDEVLVVEGMASLRGDSFSVRADKILTLDDSWNYYVRGVHVNFSTSEMDDAIITRLKGILIQSRGGIKVTLHLNIPNVGKVNYELDPAFNVQPSRQLQQELLNLVQKKEAIYYQAGNGNGRNGTNGRRNGNGNGYGKNGNGNGRH